MSSRRRMREWALAGEALAWLAWFRVALAVVPVRRILVGMKLGRGDGAGERDGAGAAPDERAMEMARRVGWAVSAAARHAPAEFVCFPQTLAGYRMLRRRGVGATIVYGVKRGENDELLAHTWLAVGEKIVTGAEGTEGYAAVERWR